MTDATAHARDNHTNSQSDSIAKTLPAAQETTACGASTESKTTQADAVDVQMESTPVSERDRFLTVLGWFFFVAMLMQYLMTAYDRPDPLPWQRGAAFQLYRVDVNTGSWVEWMQLEGIGQTMAHRIVADREEYGPFPTIDDLIRVDGIGPVTLDRLRPWLTISHEDKEQRIHQYDDGE